MSFLYRVFFFDKTFLYLKKFVKFVLKKGFIKDLDASVNPVTVKSVSLIDCPSIPIYDIEVIGRDNFALSCGVFCT